MKQFLMEMVFMAYLFAWFWCWAYWSMNYVKNHQIALPPPPEAVAVYFEALPY